MPSKINYLLGIFLSILVLISHKPVFAINNPNLLPEEKPPVIDLAKTLSPNQKKSLEDKLNNLEIESGWKIKYLSQFESSPGSAIKDYWDLDETSLLIVADPRGGNLLNFNVGEAYFNFMPRLFWVELQTRFGNQYYVKDHGEDGAVLDAINSVKICLERGGCQVVPGLPKEQYMDLMYFHSWRSSSRFRICSKKRRSSHINWIFSSSFSFMGNVIWNFWSGTNNI